ncbi:hypothetical protein NEIPOLOT_02484 [Neisseria polysaccharea ATCC 43768]|uniref:oxidoreductase n=1 Tax=Neisseria polysaccharea TaxID=489 RepID=UPI0001D9D8CA|nr:oxidoreductase FMN-binding [Neisseria polysaccharea]EFH21765.1 hypothetical protein NEIPOLOT_02484 [Neisseria polysaccharea ATCC 43768]
MLFTPFTFPNGKTAKNRIFKSAMEEQLAQNDQPSEKLVRLYDTWAKGGAGMLVTGNVMVAESGKGSINDVVISDGRSLEMLKKWAKAGTQNDTLLIMQINHAGKQSPAVVNKTPLAPSAVPLVGMDGFINPPRELTADEINGLIQQFMQTDRIQTGVAFVDKKAGAMLEMNWYMTQMDLIGQGKQPNPKLSAWKVLLKTLWENGKAGLSTGRA